MNSIDDYIVTGISAIVMIALITVLIVIPVALLIRWLF